MGEKNRTPEEDGHKPIVPPELQSEEAQDILQRLRGDGYLDEQWQFLNELTGGKKGVIASEIAGRLNINNLWIMFGRLWNINSETLRQYSSRFLKTDKGEEFRKDIHRTITGVYLGRSTIRNVTT